MDDLDGGTPMTQETSICPASLSEVKSRGILEIKIRRTSVAAEKTVERWSMDAMNLGGLYYGCTMVGTGCI